MPLPLRRPAAASVLLVGALLAFPSQSSAAIPEACAPSPKTDTSFCVSYSMQAFEAGTDVPTTQSQAPVDLQVDFANSSTSYRDEAGQPRWLSNISAKLMSSGTIRPMITGTAALPDGLLVGGDPDGSLCGQGDGSFGTCTAGHGVAFVKSSGLISGISTATFGIKQIRNETSGLGSHFAQYTARVGICLQSVIGPCSFGEQEQEVTFTIDLPAAGQPMAVDLAMPPPTTVAGVNLERFTIDSMRLHLSGRSDVLADGTVLAAGRDILRLPMRCGLVSAAGAVTSLGGATVTVAQPFTVTGCSQIEATAGRAKLLYGYSTTISGTVTDFDTQTPMVGTAVQLRACATSATIPCATIKQTKTTTAGGAFSFTVRPTKNTRYFVRVGAIDGKPATYVDKRINVAPKVTRAATRTTMPSGGTLRLTGSVSPNHAGRMVKIQRLRAGVWRTIAQDDLSSRSAYSKAFVLTGAHGSTARLRVILPAHSDHVTGISRTIAIHLG